MSNVTNAKLGRMEIEEVFRHDGRGNRVWVRNKVLGVKPAQPRQKIFPPADSFTGKGLLSIRREGMPNYILVSPGQTINWYRLNKKIARRARSKARRYGIHSAPELHMTRLEAGVK